MKKPRWRAVVKSGDKVCPRLINKYYWNEDIRSQWGCGGMSEKQEMSILITLHSYANSIHRTSKIEIWEHPKEWVKEVWNFAD